jgi:hypothetical protein
MAGIAKGNPLSEKIYSDEELLETGQDLELTGADAEIIAQVEDMTEEEVMQRLREQAAENNRHSDALRAKFAREDAEMQSLMDELFDE